jgi:hypothetical protein
MVVLSVAITILHNAWKNWAIRDVGKRHLLRNVVFTLKCSNMLVFAGLFCFQVQGTEIVQLLVANDGLAIYLVHRCLS